MSDDQYNHLFKYMETQFTAIREDSAKQQEDIRRLETNVHSEISRLDTNMTEGFARVDARLDNLDTRLETVEESQQEILNAIGDDLNKHDRWIHQLADSTGTKLSPAA